LFEEIRKNPALASESNVALSFAKKYNWISIEKTPKGILLKDTGTYLSKSAGGVGPVQTALKFISMGRMDDAKQLPYFSDLFSRGLLEEKETTQRKYTITINGKNAVASKEFAQKREFNIHDPAPRVFAGKKQQYIQFLNSVRKKLAQMGFEEMPAPLIVHEFYNFDVLFQPQNHSARTWTDTYQLKTPKSAKIPHHKKIKAIKDAHEHGGVSASTGWQYEWAQKIAERLMPAAHGTAHSARTLVEGPKVPAKYFAIARCFRPDVLDATHLIEFNQTEGFIVGEKLNFRHLLYTLKEFAIEFAGAEKVKFIPDYYPFTEPSVQLSAKHPKIGWMELGGAGMFRPEMLENLGIKGQALAWGIGIDRLAMFKLGIKDIRYLFSNDLNWLRETPMVIE
jgi:phenylalanyl-tRNA synthetase alpha chain